MDYVFDELRNNRVNVLISTSYSAMGMNFGSIDHVFLHIEEDSRFSLDGDLMNQMCGRAGRNGRGGTVFICTERGGKKRRVKAKARAYRPVARTNSWKYDAEAKTFSAGESELHGENGMLRYFTRTTGLEYSYPGVELRAGRFTLMQPEILLCMDLESENILELLNLVETVKLAYVFPIEQILFHCIATRFRFDALTNEDTCMLIDENGKIKKYYVKVRKIIEKKIKKYYKGTELRIIFSNFMYVLHEFVDHDVDTLEMHIPSVIRMDQVMRAVVGRYGERFVHCSQTFAVMDIIARPEAIPEHGNVLKMAMENMIDSSSEAEEHREMTNY
jgi:hypothetical protein